MRWGRSAPGKTSGVRVIHCVHSDLMPVYLLTKCATNEPTDVCKVDRNELAEQVEVLIAYTCLFTRD
jgi:hypothetical protein